MHLQLFNWETIVAVYGSQFADEFYADSIENRRQCDQFSVSLSAYTYICFS